MVYQECEAVTSKDDFRIHSLCQSPYHKQLAHAFTRPYFTAALWSSTEQLLIPFGLATAVLRKQSPGRAGQT